MSGLSIPGVQAPAAPRQSALAGAAASALPAVAAGLSVGGLAAGRGGYFPTAWGWACVALC